MTETAACSAPTEPSTAPPSRKLTINAGHQPPKTLPDSTEAVDGDRAYRVVVVGGGQSGLAAAHALIGRGLLREDILVLEAGPSIGHAWRTRWDSLRLFTPARYSALAGMPFPGDPDRYPSTLEVAQYLEDYAAEFSIPVQLNALVRQLRHTTDGAYELLVGNDRLRAENVIVATGPFGKPFIPAIAEQLPPAVTQLHSSEYRNPAQLPPGHVLVVGAGNSGTQIAMELAATHDVILSVGSRNPALPQKVAGVDLFRWLEALHIMDIPRTSAIGGLISRKELLIGTSLRTLRRRGVGIAGRINQIVNGLPATQDGRALAPASIVWATGFRPDLGWLPDGALTSMGHPVHTRGMTPLPGLAVLGHPWLHTRGSALIGWVKHDANYVGRAILSRTV